MTPHVASRLWLGAASFLFLASATAATPSVPAAPADAGGSNPAARPSPIRFKKVTVSAASDFECACAADINGDGKLDIVSGDTWYEAPGWTPHHFRDIGVWGRGPGESGYRRDFADLPMDVDGDGKVDIVSCDYASGEIWWSRNTGDGRPWPSFPIARPGSMETCVLAPFLKDGTPCILPNLGGQIVWYELRKRGPAPQWVEHVVGRSGADHGIGFGDVNGDGKTDIITPHGWYEQIDARNDQWVWRPEWECRPPHTGIGMPVMDVDGDGHNDVIFGVGHDYGLYWLQQMPAASPQRWIQHAIDTTWSQAHTLMLASLDRGRRPVLLTGKRYKAHDTDPGAGDPLGIYYYSFDRRHHRWEKYVIDYASQAGTGLQLTAVDLRRTGRLDIIAPGKSGLYLFENEGR